MNPTKRLYYNDSYATSFTARVLDRQSDNDGTRVALDETAFYPEGGGQPSDTGTLNGTAVIDVQSSDDGVVWHRVESPILAERVTGEVDWSRRFDHMQQHHGQHLLSAAFENLLGYTTTSFHLGASHVTIDLATPRVTEDEIRAAESEANKIVWEDRPVVTRFVAPRELAKIPLRKEPSVSGAVRIVSVDGFDHSACGGTHPSTTGAVGIVYVSRTERRGDETRVEFACGQRVLETVRDHGSILRRLASVLTVGFHELERAIIRLRETEVAHRRQLEATRREVQQYELRELLQTANQVAGVPVVVKRYVDRSMAQLQALAQGISVEGGVAILGTGTDRAQLVFASPEAFDLDCAKMLRQVLQQCGGRGGGRSCLASGGLPDPGILQSVMQAIADEVEHRIGKSI